MVDKLKHKTVGSELTQVEWEQVDGHIFESQTAGDILYALSATELKRLAKSVDGKILKLVSGLPAWADEAGGTPQYGKTITLGESGSVDYNDLSDAYDYAKTLTPTASNRILILIYPGVCTENLIMDTEYIDLRGMNRGSCKITSASGWTILKSVGNVLIDNLTIESTRNFDDASSAAIKEMTAGTRENSFILNCLIQSNARYTIFQTRSFYRNCHIFNTLSDIDATAVQSPYGAEGQNATFRDCVIESKVEGKAFFDMDCRLFGCRLFGNRYAIFNYQTHGLMINCDLESYRWGIYYMAPNAEMFHNKIKGGSNGGGVSGVRGRIFGGSIVSIINSYPCVRIGAGYIGYLYGVNLYHAGTGDSIDAGGANATVYLSGVSMNKAIDYTDLTVNWMKGDIDYMVVDVTDISNPPTDAELDAIFGTPTAVGKGFHRILNDNGAGNNVYLVWSDGTNWWHTAGTKAV